MTNRELRFEAEELLDRYVQCLDEDRLEEWPDFFSEKAVYKIISRVNVERNHPLATMFCDSRDMMKDRVVAIRNASVFSQRYENALPSRFQMPLHQGITGTAAAERRTIRVVDVRLDPRYVSCGEEVRSEMLFSFEYGPQPAAALTRKG